MDDKRNIEELVAEYERYQNSGKSFYMDAEALLDVMDYYLSESRDFDAALCMRVALRLHPDNVDVLLSQAYRLKDQGDWQAAIQTVKALPDQKLRTVQLFYAECALSLQFPDKADEIIQDVMAANRLEAGDCVVEYMELLLDYGFYQRTLEWAHLLPPDLQNQFHPLELCAEANYQLQQYQEALPLLEAMVEQNPMDAMTWVQMAETQFKMGQTDAANDSVENALALEPEMQRAQKLRIQVLLTLYAMQPEAERQQTTIALHMAAFSYLSSHPEDYQTTVQLAEWEIEEANSPADYNSALGWLQLANRYCPADVTEKSRILFNIARLQIRLSHFDDALETLLCTIPQGFEASDLRIRLAEYLFAAFSDTSDFGRALEARTFAIAQLVLALAEPAVVSDENLSKVLALLVSASCYEPARAVWERLCKIPNRFSESERQQLAAAQQRLRLV